MLKGDIGLGLMRYEKLCPLGPPAPKGAKMIIISSETRAPPGKIGL
jgi:hypothetical protein